MAGTHCEVVILCGGRGSRLRSLTNALPKPMVPIGQKPFLEILINQVQSFGFRRFIFCAGYKGLLIKEFLSKQFPSKEWEFLQETGPLGTAGALKSCEEYISGDTFLVLNGDTYCPVDFLEFLRFHQTTNGIGSIVVAPTKGRSNGGGVVVNQKQRIVSFEPDIRRKKSLLNAGIYALNRRVFQFIPADRFSSLESDIFHRLTQEGLYAYITERFVCDIGTPERLEEFRKTWHELISY